MLKEDWNLRLKEGNTDRTSNWHILFQYIAYLAWKGRNKYSRQGKEEIIKLQSGKLKELVGQVQQAIEKRRRLEMKEVRLIK